MMILMTNIWHHDFLKKSILPGVENEIIIHIEIHESFCGDTVPLVHMRWGLSIIQTYITASMRRTHQQKKVSNFFLISAVDFRGT